MASVILMICMLVFGASTFVLGSALTLQNLRDRGECAAYFTRVEQQR